MAIHDDPGIVTPNVEVTGLVRFYARGPVERRVGRRFADVPCGCSVALGSAKRPVTYL